MKGREKLPFFQLYWLVWTSSTTPAWCYEAPWLFWEHLHLFSAYFSSARMLFTADTTCTSWLLYLPSFLPKRTRMFTSGLLHCTIPGGIIHTVMCFIEVLLGFPLLFLEDVLAKFLRPDFLYCIHKCSEIFMVLF